jgi:hypothetical protein
LNRVRDKFHEDIESVLEDAIRKHFNISSTSIPWWIYGLLIFFAMDNVMNWIQHPIVFYPLMMLVSVVALLYSMGLGGVMVPVAR